MAFQKGHKKKGGRKLGVSNKTTATVKETFERVFNQLQTGKIADLASWARSNPTEFYRLAAKLIPTNVNASVAGNVTINWPLPKTKLDL